MRGSDNLTQENIQDNPAISHAFHLRISLWIEKKKSNRCTYIVDENKYHTLFVTVSSQSEWHKRSLAMQRDVDGSSCTLSYQPSYSRAAWPALLRQTHGTCCCRVYGVFTSDVTATPEYGGWAHPSRRNDIPLFIADTYASTIVGKREREWEKEHTRSRRNAQRRKRPSLSPKWRVE